jgi:hypothetical protein
MPVIPQGQGLGQISGERFEPAEVERPALVVELEPDLPGVTAVEKARDALGKCRRLDHIEEVGTELDDRGVGSIIGHEAVR